MRIFLSVCLCACVFVCLCVLVKKYIFERHLSINVFCRINTNMQWWNYFPEYDPREIRFFWCMQIFCGYYFWSWWKFRIFQEFPAKQWTVHWWLTEAWGANECSYNNFSKYFIFVVLRNTFTVVFVWANYMHYCEFICFSVLRNLPNTMPYWANIRWVYLEFVNYLVGVCVKHTFIKIIGIVFRFCWVFFENIAKILNMINYLTKLMSKIFL